MRLNYVPHYYGKSTERRKAVCQEVKLGFALLWRKSDILDHVEV